MQPPSSASFFTCSIFLRAASCFATFRLGASLAADLDSALRGGKQVPLEAATNAAGEAITVTGTTSDEIRWQPIYPISAPPSAQSDFVDHVTQAMVQGNGAEIESKNKSQPADWPAIPSGAALRDGHDPVTNVTTEWNSTGPMTTRYEVRLPNMTAVHDGADANLAWLQRLKEGGLAKYKESNGENETWRTEYWMPGWTQEGKMPSTEMIQDDIWKRGRFLQQVNNQSDYLPKDTRPPLFSNVTPDTPLYMEANSAYFKRTPSPPVPPLVSAKPLWPLLPETMPSL